MQVHAVGSSDIFVPEPQGDGGGVNTMAEKVDGAAYLYSFR
jgi:hypothetical protein